MEKTTTQYRRRLYDSLKEQGRCLSAQKNALLKGLKVSARARIEQHILEQTKTMEDWSIARPQIRKKIMELEEKIKTLVKRLTALEAPPTNIFQRMLK